MARGLVVVAVLAIVGIAALVIRNDAGPDAPRHGPVVPNPSSTTEAPAASLVGTTTAVLDECRSLRSVKIVRVLCPQRLPRAQWYVRYRTLEGSRSRYLMELRGDADTHGAHHVLAGGRSRPFSLQDAHGRWPSRVPRAGARCCARAGDLGLIGARERGAGEWEPVRMTVVRRTSIRSRPALLLQAAPHPDGGIHGGHLLVVWNQGRRGYVFSIHTERADTPTQQEQTVALAAADAMASGG